MNCEVCHGGARVLLFGKCGLQIQERRALEENEGELLGCSALGHVWGGECFWFHSISF